MLCNSQAFKFFVSAAFAALTGFLSFGAFAGERPKPDVFGDSLAFNISLEHTSKNELRKIASLGISNLRVGIMWPQVEKRRGHYSWNLEQYRMDTGDGVDETPGFNYDNMISFIHDLGFHMSTTLYIGNPLYTGRMVLITHGERQFPAVAAPRTPEAIDAFAAFAAATAKHYSDLYGPDSFTWLLWNEPDLDDSFPPKSDAAVVGQLVTTTCQAIKKAVPDAYVMAPALSSRDGGGFRYDYIRRLFASSNPLSCLDAFTVHPYRPTAPETALEHYKELLAFLKPRQSGKKTALAVDEWGYPLIRNVDPQWRFPWRRYSLDEQAAIYLRMYLVNFSAGLPLTILYEWRDSGANPDYDEHNFGMTTFDGKDKPVISMWRYVMPMLKGRRLLSVERPSGCGKQVHALLLGARFRQESDALVAWTENFSSPYRLAGPFDEVTDIFGNKLAGDMPRKGVALGGMPLLIKMNRAAAASVRCLKPAGGKN